MLNKKAMELYTNLSRLSRQMHRFSHKVEHRHEALLLLARCNVSGDKDAINSSESSIKKGNLILQSESNSKNLLQAVSLKICLLNGKL